MNSKPILIVAGEPNSVFLEILFKAYKIKKFSSPLILIASHQLLRLQMKALKFKKKVNLLDFNKLNQYKLDLENSDNNFSFSCNRCNPNRYVASNWVVCILLYDH